MNMSAGRGNVQPRRRKTAKSRRNSNQHSGASITASCTRCSKPLQVPEMTMNAISFQPTVTYVEYMVSTDSSSSDIADYEYEYTDRDIDEYVLESNLMAHVDAAQSLGFVYGSTTYVQTPRSSSHNVYMMQEPAQMPYYCQYQQMSSQPQMHRSFEPRQSEQSAENGCGQHETCAKPQTSSTYTVHEPSSDEEMPGNNTSKAGNSELQTLKIEEMSD